MNTLILIIGFVVLIRIVFVGLDLINDKLADIRTILQDMLDNDLGRLE